MMMRMNLMKVLCCAAGCCLVFTGRAQSVPVTMQEPLAIAMQATGAELSGISVTGRAAVTRNDQSLDALQKITAESARRIGLEPGGYESEERCGGGRQTVRVFALLHNARIMIFAQRDAAADPDIVRLTIRIVAASGEEKDITGYKDRIYATLQNFQAAPRITTCLEGYLDGRLRKDEWALCLRDAFDAIGARIDTATDDDDYASYAGYSPLIGGAGILAGENRININMAMRYHSFDQRTYVVIGSPVILKEY